MRVRYLYLIFFIVSIILFSFNGCDAESSASSKTNLSLSAQRVAPGTFITLRDTSITEGSELEVSFKNNSNFNVTLKTTLTKDAEAKIAVPIVIDTSTGKSIESTLSVSINGSKQADIEVLALPELSSGTGEVVKMYLKYLKDRLQVFYTSIYPSSTLSSNNITELKKEILTQIESIDKSLNELETSSSLSFFSSDMGAITLKGNELRELDKVIFAVLDGIVEEVNSDVSMRKAYTRDDDISKFENEFTNVLKDVKNGETVLIGFTGAIVTLSSLALSAEVAASTTFAVLAGGVCIITVGPILETFTFIKSLATGETYVFGEALTSEAIDAMINVGFALGGDYHSVLNFIGFMYSGYSSAVAGGDLICNAKPINENFVEYCANRENATQREFEISTIRFFTDVYIRDESEVSNILGGNTYSFMLPGSEGELSFRVSGSKTSMVNVIIDWGDGQRIQMSVRSGVYNTDIKHIYNLKSDETESFYTITIYATDGLSNKTSGKHYVQLKDSYKQNITFTKVPTKILTYQSYTWGITIDGAVDNYKYIFHWGDGTTSNGSINTAGEILLTHTYIKDGFFTVKMDIYKQDYEDDITTQTYQIEVRKPVSIVDIAGPKQLDLDERGNWDVTLKDGWEPYSVSVDWGDGSSPLKGSTSKKVFGFHYAYKEKGLYSLTLSIVGEGGSESTKSIMIQVPKEPDTFAITTTLTCPTDNGGFVTFNGKGVGTLTNKTDLIFQFDADNNNTVSAILIDGHFSLEKTIIVDAETTVKVEMNGVINIDDFTDEVSGSGNLSESNIDKNGVYTCTGTWKSE